MMHEVREEQDLGVVAEEWEEATPVEDSDVGRVIRCVSDVPLMGNCQFRPIRSLEEPIVVEGAVTGLTGDAGSGKSTVACAMAGRIHRDGHPILILDRENPLVVVDDRFRRLNITDDNNFRVWGGWTGQEAPLPSSAVVLTWVSSCELTPLIIVDSLSAFFVGDQNSASDMRTFMNQCRRPADLGAAVVVLHHDGKGDNAKDYRGSSDFKASVDIAFHVSNAARAGRLARIVLRCFKSRFGFSGEVVYQYANGRVERTHSSSAATSEKFAALLMEHPGVSGARFEQLATGAQLGRNGARKYLDEGQSLGTVRQQGTGRNVRYFPGAVAENHAEFTCSPA